MAKRKLVKKDQTVKTTAPKFKPGDKPYLEYDGVMLNANVPWNELVAELISKDNSKENIADCAQCSLQVINEIEANNYKNLSFRAGARIVALHCQFYPEFYIEENFN